MEYIEKNRIINLLEHNSKVYHYADRDKENIVHDTVQTLCRVIIEAEAADVQPVKRGKWDFQGYQLFKCTNCKEMFTQNQLEAMQNHKDCEEWDFPNFCPHCGADMRGEDNG